MSIGINTNLASLTAQRNLGRNSADLSVTINRLSSGLRINSAKDDAAGLAISERMQTQIRGMNQAARNATDGISMLQTAEGATTAVVSSMQRIRELAVQSANATNSGSDRKALQAEVEQLKQEIDRIGRTAEFNGMQVFDQSRVKAVAGSTDPAIDVAMEGLKMRWLAQSEKLIFDAFGIQGDGQTMKVYFKYEGAGGTAAYVSSRHNNDGPGFDISMTLDMDDFTTANLPDGGNAPMYNDRIIAHEMMHAIMATGQSWGKLAKDPSIFQWFIEGTAEFIHGADERVAGDGLTASIAKLNSTDLQDWVQGSPDYSSGYLAVRYMDAMIKDAGGGGVKDVLQYLQTNNVEFTDAISNASSGAFTGLAHFYNELAIDAGGDETDFTNLIRLNLSNSDTGAATGKDATGTASEINAKDIMPDSVLSYTTLQSFKIDWGDAESSGGGMGLNLAFQVGANANQVIHTRTDAMNLGALDIQDLDISTVDGSTIALDKIDTAIDYVNFSRSRMGAQMSRFEHTVSNLKVSVENLSASRSRILDADYAKETANLARTQILQQAGTAMVAQANQLPQMVLSLLT